MADSTTSSTTRHLGVPSDAAPPATPPSQEASEPAASDFGIGRSGRLIGSTTSPRFVTCILILIGSAVSMQAIATSFGQYFRKRAVPLKRSLAAFDARQLAPDFGLHVRPVPPISDEVLQTLGTEQYTQLRIVDLTKKRSDATSVAHVFVTYYTGQPDMVPHVPDECYQAGGYALLESHNTHIHVPGVGAKGDNLPVRELAFGMQSRGLLPSLQNTSAARLHVLYFFLTNGTFVTTRNQVRMRTASLTDQYAYYAKIEVRFSDYSFGKVAGESESLAAMQRLMRKILPILLNDHFADWDALTHRR